MSTEKQKTILLVEDEAIIGHGRENDPGEIRL